MSESDNNQFRQVATILISITIIVSGLVYNYTAEKTEAQFGVTSGTGSFYSGFVTNMESQVNTNPITRTTNTTPTTNTINKPKPTNKVPLTNTITITPADAAEKIDIVLAPIEQFISLMESITFAHSGPGLNLPNGNNPTINSLPTVIPDKQKETIETSLPETSEISPERNTVLEQIKKFSGYLKWGEFRDNFREAQQKYAGTDECMINIKGLGCLVQW